MQWREEALILMILWKCLYNYEAIKVFILYKFEGGIRSIMLET